MENVLSPTPDLGAPALPDAGLGALETARGRLPLARVEVRGSVRGAACQFTLRQTFVNAFDEPLEALYVFPLPDRAAVTRCRFEVAGRVIEARLRERGEARAEYQAALAQGRRAALAEEDRPGVFTVSAGNLQPREAATVELTWAAPLSVEDGEATLRVPLVVAPRYVPGAPLPGASVGAGTASDTAAAPDASRITPPVLLPGFPNPVALELEVALHGVEPERLRCSLHAALTRPGPSSALVRLQPGERLDRDFLLRFPLEPGRAELLLAPDAEGGEGTWQLTLLPPSVSGERPRDAVFLLDRSGSMEGWKLVAARRALARMVDSLSASDRFAALAFANAVAAPPELPARALHPATDRNRFRAVEFLAGLDANGGTEMHRALSHACELLSATPAGRERLLVLVTDGQVANEDQLVALLAKTPGIRVLAVGIDLAVNEGLLRRLAGLNGGAAELVESEDRLDAAMERLHRLVRTPALSGLALAPEGLELLPGTAAPDAPPFGFAGVPVVARGRYRGEPRGALHVSATLPDGGAYRARVEAALTPPGAAAPAALWARARLRALEDQYAARPERRAALHPEIVQTSLRFGVLCRFTAYVAADAEVASAGKPAHQVVQPVQAPVGRSANGAPPARGGGGSGSYDGFGLAKAANRATKTQAGVLKGKFSYMSPEQVRGLPLDPRTEVFTLGVVLFELVTGERLFQGESDFTVLELVRKAEVPWELLRTAEQRALEPVLRKALAADPDDRYRHAGELADALAAAQAAGKLGPAVDLAAHLRAVVPERAEAARRLAEAALARAPEAPASGYLPVTKLDVGGMTESWLALQRRADGTPELVVVQRVLPHLVEDEEFVALFLDSVGPIAHPGVIGLHRVQHDGRTWAMVQEYVPGTDARTLFQAHRKKGAPMPAALAAQIVERAARALAFGNTLGALCRDLEPGAITLGFDGAVKVAHFAPPSAELRQSWASAAAPTPAPPPAQAPTPEPTPPGLAQRVVRFFRGGKGEFWK